MKYLVFKKALFHQMNNTQDFLKSNGVYYTNAPLANQMIDYLEIEYSRNFSLIEPAVGEGHILSFIVKRFLDKNRFKHEHEIKKLLEENFCAFDLREEAIVACKQKLDSLVSKFYKNLKIDWNIFCLDALDYPKLSKLFDKYDYVISNPPYISRRNLDTDKVSKLKTYSRFCKKFNYDMYYYFLEIGFSLWNKKGKIAYITPNTYLRSRSATYLMQYIIRNKFLERILDYGDELKFEGAETYTAISVFSQKNHNISIVKVNKKNEVIISYKQLSLEQRTFLFDNEFIIHEPFVYLGDIAEIKNGLATLQDKVFIIKEDDIQSETDDRLTIIKNNLSYIIEKKFLRCGFKPSKPEKKYYVIFPYTDSNKKVHNLEKQAPFIYDYLQSLLPQSYQNKYALYFGRTQGFLNYSSKKICIARVANVANQPFKQQNEGFTLSGLSITLSKYYTDRTYMNILNYLNSSKVAEYLSNVSKDYASGYKNISSTDLKRIKIPLRILQE